jgi:hypothetical protein
MTVDLVVAFAVSYEEDSPEVHGVPVRRVLPQTPSG